VPKMGVYDGERPSRVRRGRQLIYTRELLRLKGTLRYGFQSSWQGPTRTPKEWWERANGFWRRSFMPGRHFTAATNFTGQLVVAGHQGNVRVHSGLVSSVGAHRGGPAAMITLPAASCPTWTGTRPGLPAGPWLSHKRTTIVHRKRWPAGACAGRRRQLVVTSGATGGGGPPRAGAGQHVTVTDPSRPGPGAARALACLPKVADTGWQVRGPVRL